MITPEMSKNVLGSKDDVRDKIKSQKERMMRSVVEGQKYFIGPEKRIFTVKGWGWEEIIYNSGYCYKRYFIKKGKKTDWRYDKKNLLIYVESGKLQILYSKENNKDSVCEIVLTDGDAFNCVSLLNREEYAVMDTIVCVISAEQKNDDEILL